MSDPGMSRRGLLASLAALVVSPVGAFRGLLRKRRDVSASPRVLLSELPIRTCPTERLEIRDEPPPVITLADLVDMMDEELVEGEPEGEA